jgi:hypothetical protein
MLVLAEKALALNIFKRHCVQTFRVGSRGIELGILVQLPRKSWEGERQIIK